MISAVQPDEVAWSFKALEAGALTVLAKPAGPKSPQFDAQARPRPIRERAGHGGRRDPTATHHPSRTAAASLERCPFRGEDRGDRGIDGGPAALAKIVSKLGPSSPFRSSSSSTSAAASTAGWWTGSTASPNCAS
jgi:chemotaxis response regulator CheB